MNLCYVSREFPPELPTAGIGTYLDVVSSSMALMGNSVVIVTSSTKKESDEYDHLGRRVIRIKVASSGGFFDNLKFMLNVNIWIKRLNVERKIDLIEVPDYRGQGLFLKMSSFSIPISIRLHGGQEVASVSDRLSFSPYVRATYILEWISLNCVADHVSSPSEYWFSFVRKKLLFFRGTKDVFPNPIFTVASRKLKDKRDNVLLYVGRLEERKGVHDIAWLIDEFFEAYPSARVEFIGRDCEYNGVPMSQYILNNTKKSNHDNIIFKGQLANDLVRERMLSSKLLIMPSYRESFGLVALEAMASGLPVLAYDGTALPEVLGEDNAYTIVKKGNNQGLLDRLIELFGDDLRLQEISENSLMRLANNYELSIVESAIYNIYCKVINTNFQTNTRCENKK